MNSTRKLKTTIRAPSGETEEEEEGERSGANEIKCHPPGRPRHRHGPASWEPSFKYEKWPHPHPARPDTQRGDINSFVTRWESHKLLTQPNAPDHESPGSLLTQRAGQMLIYPRNLVTLHSASFSSFINL